MTKKKQEPLDEVKEIKTPATQKRILYELVAESPLREYVIVGALAKAGLLSQFEQEKKEYGYPVSFISELLECKKSLINGLEKNNVNK